MSRAKVIANKKLHRAKRKLKVRSKISGVANKPRVSIFKSNRYLTVQAIDDTAGTTLAGLNSKTLDLRTNKEGAVALAAKFADMLKEKDITEVVYDRNGYVYHGVVAAFADALRENGIKL
ncbi:MAG: 50S ribosomal protein L18 [Arcobacter butzleri]|jgi:large subunit ribosomal protein L18|nr:50S ribosomal protein L18 [Arcobacteraceae bacterium]MDY0365076.1 50S ribosomal protein L18 [Arcobacteraceae bacterium]NLO16952.1 50S ribosomal protein L18 [Aliarcobacter butzleri]